MEIRKEKLLFFFYFLIPFLSFSQQPVFHSDTQARFVYQLSWTPDEYAYFYVVEIEKEENDIYRLFLREDTQLPVLNISLPYGLYRYRVIPYDLLNLPGIVSEWMYFEIIQAPQPVIEEDDEPSVYVIYEPVFFEQPEPEVIIRDSQFSFFIGAGAEANRYTRTGAAFGGGLSIGMVFFPVFSAGLRNSFFYNFDSISSIELLVFARYYLPFIKWPKITDGPFVQAELGAMVFMESGYFEYREAAPSFAGGAALGWRINLGKNWFIDPSFRFGYPFMWGVNISAGYKFN